MKTTSGSKTLFAWLIWVAALMSFSGVSYMYASKNEPLNSW